MKKKHYVSPTMEELRADEMHLLAGSPNVEASAGGFGQGEDSDPDPEVRPRP